MKEWYAESQPGKEIWSREYRQFMLGAAKAERQRWTGMLPDPRDHFKVPLVSGTTWTNLGPTSADAEINGGTTLHVSDGGRAASIIADGSRLFVATAGGGVWRSSDGGGVWTPITESLGTLSCGSLAMDPVNHDTLYLGLGDPFDGTGVGLVKTSDAGNTWSDPVFLGDSTIIPQVMVDPADRTIVLAATNKGLYRSTNSGGSFALVNIPTGGAEAPYVWTLASTGGSSFVLTLEAAPSATTGTTDGQVWWSNNHGATWTRATGFTAAAGIGRATVASAPSSPNVVYGMAAIPLSAAAADLADVFKSTNGGQTWTALGKTKKRYTNSNNESTTLGTLLNGQGWYNQVVIVDPTNPSKVYFGGALLLARSSDGGSTFTQVSNWLAQFSLPYVHADFHAAAFDASGNLYVGTDGGVFLSADGGGSFTDALNLGMVTHLLYSVGSSPQDRNAVIGGFQDNGTRVRVGTSSVFNQYIGGDGFGSHINRTNAQVMLGSLYYDRIYKSTNGGATFSSASSGITESNNSSTAPFITRIVPWEGAGTGNEVYTFSNTKVYRSTNYASSWTAVGTPTTTGAIRHIGVAAQNANVIGVVASGGRVFLSSNGGTSFTQVASGKRDDSPLPTPAPLPNSMLSLSYVHFDVSNSNTVYVASVAADATASHLWKSTNFGASWTAIDGNGLPAGVPVNIIKSDPTPDPANPGQVLYAGTHLGVYKSTDGGASWTRFGANMPLVSVMDLYISPDASLVRAASYGRGFWELGQGPGGDFSISASPAGVSAAQGGAATSTIATALTTGGAQSVSLSASGLPTGASASFAPTSVTAGGSSTLTLTAGAATPAGTYSVTVTGSAPSGTHTTTVTFTVTASDFTLSAAPASVSAQQGGSATSTIATAVSAGNAQSVALSASGLPAGASAGFAPASVNAGGSSTLTLTAGAATPAGTYTVTVTGSGASATHTTTVSFTVTAVPSDFAMSASPASVSAAQGGSATTSIATTAVAGSPESVTFSASGLPTGASASFAPGSVTAGASSTLTLTAAAGTPAGSYTVTVTGTAASATHTTSVGFTVTVPVANDFALGASPASVAAAQGGSTTSSISTTVTSGSGQNVVFAASGLPTGAGASFSPASVNAGASSTLTLTAGAATAPGTYSVTVTGTGTSATHTTTVSFTVTASDFAMSAAPASVSAAQGGSGSSVISTAVTSGGGQNVVFAASNLPTGAGASFSPASVNAGSSSTLTLTAGAATPAGTYTVTVTGTGASATHTTTVSFTVTQSSGETLLVNGVAATALSGAAGSQQFFRIDVPAGETTLVFTLSGGSGDADMYVKLGARPTTSVYDCRPFVTGNNETCSISSPAGGTYYVMLNAFSAYSAVSLRASTSSPTDPLPLARGVNVTGISGGLNSQQFWRVVTVPAGATITIAITGSTSRTSDADLYVRRGSAPTTAQGTFDCRPFVTGSNETCQLSNTTGAPADYYVLLNGFTAYSGVTLSANWQ